MRGETSGSVSASQLRVATAVAEAVEDPELPFLTVKDLGILRGVIADHGVVVAQVSPTYSGCPAVSVIEDAVLAALTEAGFTARVERVLSPPWTTGFITDEGREKLLANGIAPPAVDTAEGSVEPFFSQRRVNCPQCESADTQIISEFGSTPCKAQYRCNCCREPFDHFKCH